MQNQGQKQQTTPTGKVKTYPFELPPLEYGYDALEPFIDAATMRLHHDKHHQTYIDNLNKAIKDYSQLHDLSIEEMMGKINDVPSEIRETVINNGGGHANHTFFWTIMSPGMENARPDGDLAQAIDERFGSFDEFKTRFEEAGVKQFGSGWVYLATNEAADSLEIVTMPNQGSIITLGKFALVANDVWEHAYYLKYNNRRPEYLKAWWNTVNWKRVGERLAEIKAGRIRL